MQQYQWCLCTVSLYGSTSTNPQTTCRCCSKFSVAPMSIWTLQNSSTVSSSVVLALFALDFSLLPPDMSLHLLPYSSLLLPPYFSLLLPDFSLLLPYISLLLPPDFSLLLAPYFSLLLPPDFSLLLTPYFSLLLPSDFSLLSPDFSQLPPYFLPLLLPALPVSLLLASLSSLFLTSPCFFWTSHVLLTCLRYLFCLNFGHSLLKPSMHFHSVAFVCWTQNWWNIVLAAFKIHWHSFEKDLVGTVTWNYGWPDTKWLLHITADFEGNYPLHLTVSIHSFLLVLSTVKQ